jgi:hypothetical protein
LLRDNFREPVRTVHKEEGKKLGGEGGKLSHQSRQNRAETMAEATDSDEVFLNFGGSSGEREKRGEGGDAGPYIGGLGMGKGARVCLGRGDGRWRCVGLGWTLSRGRGGSRPEGPTSLRRRGGGWRTVRVCA